ncbi:MAG: protein kinase domain-containing protein, partial [Pirellulaceae bacterium]
MGEVYLAQQEKPVRRLVAIKTIQQDLEGTQILQRFQSEQQTLANMEHPNIARIIDAGITESGTHYIAMEYVHGEQLLEYSQSKNLGVKAKIELMLQCCQGIQHAHKKGTIHRDIKPNNILVTLVDGDPLVKVIDFGIAKALASSAIQEELSGSSSHGISPNGTVTGVSPGTPRFMSPEQYGSKASQIDTRSDIYSLGAVLYTLLVEAPPFDDLSLENLSLEQIKQEITKCDPIAPSERLPEAAGILRGALDAIVLKSMQRDPEDRYQTVGELMEDLKCYLNDLPVKAHAESTWKKATRFSKRHRILLASMFLAIAGLLGGLIMSILQERRASESEKQAKRQSYSSDLLLASMAISKRNYKLAQEMLDRHASESDVRTHSKDHSGRPRLDWRLLNSQIPQEPTILAQFPDKLYYGLSLLERQEAVSGGKDSHLRFVEISTGKLRLDIDTKQKEVNGLARSPDGKMIATGGDDGTVKFWNVETGAQVGGFQASSGAVYQIGWTHDGTRFITAGNTPNASVWTVPNFEFEQFLDSSNEALECLSVGPQGQVAYGSDKGVIRIADLSQKGDSNVQSLSVFNSRAFDVNRCSTVVFSPSGKMLAVGLNSGYLILLQQRNATYQVVERIRFSTTVTAVDFSLDESKIAIGEDNGSVHVLSLPKDWPTQSRLRFTKYFLDQNRNAYPELDPVETDSLWQMVSKTEPADLDKYLPLDLDRVYLEFKQPMKNVIFSDNFVREWTDQAGNTKPEWKEIPKAVVFRADGVELHFENPYSGWSEPSQLGSQGRLSSWNTHSRRVASILWDEPQNLLLSFSEDGSIRTVKTDLSESMSIGGDDVKSFSLLPGSKLAVLKADDRAYVITLDPNRIEPRANVSFFEGSAATSGYAFGKEDQLILPYLDPKDTNSRFQICNWDINTQEVARITQFPSDLTFRYLVGKLQQNRLAILAEKQTANATHEKRMLSLASWDLNSQKIA